MPHARHRHRRSSRSEFAEGQQPFSPLQEWRSASPTVKSLKENADRLRVSIEAVKKGLHTARYSAVSSSKDAKLRISQYLQAINSLNNRQVGRVTDKVALDRSEEAANDLHKVLKELTSKRDSQSFAAGVMLFGGLMFLAGSQPWCLPWAYVAFTIVCLPMRCYDFLRKKWGFFLLDFCYWANVLVVSFLLLAPQNRQLYAAVYALADGPLAAALIVWQSAWVFGSAAHTISVLIHQLPGLALFALKFCSPPEQLRGILPASGTENWPSFSFFWSVVVPMAFYLAWQLFYFLIVQILSRKFIKVNGYDTSYTCLARRAAKTNNFWNRTVRRGSPLRRALMYGFFQAIYTILVLLCLVPISLSVHLSFVWQVVKVAFPIWHGSRYICEKVPRHAVLKVWRQQQLKYQGTARLS